MNWRKRVGIPLVALILVLAGGTAGALALTDSGQLMAASNEHPSATEIAQQVQDAHAEMDGYEAVQVTTVEAEDWTYTSKARIWLDGSDNQRTEVLSGNQSGDVFVANETAFVSYDASEETVDVLNRSTLDESASTVGVHQAAMQSLEHAEVSYQGTASVAGHETYVLQLTPMNGSNEQAQAPITQTLWVDQDTFQIIQIQSEGEIDGQEATVTTQFRDITVDADIPNSTFEFEPPADAEVQEVEA